MAAKKTNKKTLIPATTDAAETPKPVAKKAVKKVAAKKAVAAPKKVALETATKKSAPRPSLDDLARAAYLNYRRRVEQSLPGDSRGDWLEAERQFSGQV